MNRKMHSSWLALAALTVGLLASACKQQPEPTAASPSPASDSAVAASPLAQVSDIDVTEHVQTALRQKESLKDFDVAVVTLKGDVRLTGMLDTQTQIDDALQIARAADGAHAVHNELTLKN